MDANAQDSKSVIGVHPFARVMFLPKKHKKKAFTWKDVLEGLDKAERGRNEMGEKIARFLARLDEEAPRAARRHRIAAAWIDELSWFLVFAAKVIGCVASSLLVAASTYLMVGLMGEWFPRGTPWQVALIDSLSWLVVVASFLASLALQLIRAYRIARSWRIGRMDHGESREARSPTNKDEDG